MIFMQVLQNDNGNLGYDAVERTRRSRKRTGCRRETRASIEAASLAVLTAFLTTIIEGPPWMAQCVAQHAAPESSDSHRLSIFIPAD
jgi:hypothetical protein